MGGAVAGLEGKATMMMKKKKRELDGAASWFPTGNAVGDHAREAVQSELNLPAVLALSVRTLATCSRSNRPFLHLQP